MNCDEAFEYLTDSSLRDHQELRWHLELCPRCRQMKEILDPALELFDPPASHDEEELTFPEFEESSFEDSFLESDYPDLFNHESSSDFSADFESDNEKESSPFTAWEMVHLANQAARRSVPHSFEEEESESPPKPQRDWMRYFGFFLLGGALVYGLLIIGFPQTTKEPHSRFTLEDRCLWKNSELIEKYTSRKSVVRSCTSCHQTFESNHVQHQQSVFHETPKEQ